MKLNYFLPFKNRFLTAGIVLLASSTLLTSCLKDNSNEVEPIFAVVSFTQAAASEKTVSIYVDGKGLETLLFGKSTNLYRAGVGNRLITTTVGGTQNQLSQQTITLAQDKYYSIFVANKLGSTDSVSTVVVEDTYVNPAAGKAMVRFVQLSPDTKTFDVFNGTSTTPIFAAKAFKSASSFMEIEPGTPKFAVRETGATTDAAVILDQTITAGNFYTIVLSGQVNGTGDKALKAFVTVLK